jgi:hypothetical protein
VRLFSIQRRRLILTGKTPAWIFQHPRKGYLIAAALSCPEWADRSTLHLFYGEARRRTVRDGALWVVDHIIPLTHHDICGLTVPANMRVIRWRENAKRSNCWWEWTLDFFDSPEQLKLF